jgi:hypothetical protein
LGDLGLSRRIPTKMVGRKVDNPRWLSPEVMEDLPYNEMADIFSLGIVFWELLERQMPYDEFNISFSSELERKIRGGLRPSIREDHKRSDYGKLVTGNDYRRRLLRNRNV